MTPRESVKEEGETMTLESRLEGKARKKCNHEMVWKCKNCGLEVNPKHSHKTCIDRFDEKVKSDIRRARRKIKERVAKIWCGDTKLRTDEFDDGVVFALSEVDEIIKDVLGEDKEG